MELPAVDPRLSAQQALQNDPVQRKLQIDALRERLAEPGKDEAAARKLKEACQGFESIFLQRIWEQMRKSVGKEGYLHSRDEESYQAMFDQELAKKMAEAGGIGLADMLQEQLSVKLGKASIASSPGMLKGKQQLLPLEDLAMPLPTVPGFNDRSKTKVEELYTPLEDGAEKQQIEKQPANKGEQTTDKSQVVLEDRLGTHPNAVGPARNSALSAMTQPVGELTKQPGLGMQAQFMLGASLLPRTPSVAAGNSDIQNQAGQAEAQAENSLLPEMIRAAGQISGPSPTGTENALAQANSLPPLPQLDNNPLARRSETAPGQLAGAAGEPEEIRPQHRVERGPNLSGISMAENAVKKNQVNPVVQNRPVVETSESQPVTQNRFAGRIGRPLRAGQPEVGRAVLDEPSILQPPMQNMGRVQAPRNEAEIKDITPPTAQQSGIRQISQAEVEAALQRMAN